MIFHETELIKKSRLFATEVLQQLPDYFYYHNLIHTEEVVIAAVEIGENSGLNVYQLELLVAAAWFHDLGYSRNIEDHEEESIVMMEEQLEKWKYSHEQINTIKDIIRSTKIPQTCPNIITKVMCDADLYHLAEESYLEKSEALRKEINAIKKLDLSKEEWLKMSIQFMRKHNYFTEYAQENLKPKKLINLKILENKDTSTD